MGPKTGPNKKTVGISGPNKKTVCTSGSTSMTGSNRNSLKRSCSSAFARWFGDPDDEQANALDAGESVEPEVQQTDQVDAGQRVDPEVIVEDQNQPVQNEDQIEFELTGTQEIMHEEASQSQNDEHEVEAEQEQQIDQEVHLQAPFVQVRLRRPSERIMKNKLAKKIEGQGSSPQTALDLDDT